jgi:hypothetical protein
MRVQSSTGVLTFAFWKGEEREASALSKDLEVVGLSSCGSASWNVGLWVWHADPTGKCYCADGAIISGVWGGTEWLQDSADGGLGGYTLRYMLRMLHTVRMHVQCHPYRLT